MGSQNRGIIIQKNNGFTEQRYYNIEKQWVHRIEVLYRKTMGSQNRGIKYRKTMGSQNRGIIIQKNNGFTEQRYYNIEKQWVHRIEVL